MRAWTTRSSTDGQPASASSDYQENGVRNFALEPLIFFDGDCGFCDRSIRWVARHDGGRFKFAPLGGRTFLASVPEQIRRRLPDTMVVMTASGQILTKGLAAGYILRTMGGPWRILALVLGCLPLSFVDAGYTCVARNRHRIARINSCEIPSVAQRKRFKS
jgi:predicted DCC family thiol-disulfide oxidoreductase YuxK